MMFDDVLMFYLIFLIEKKYFSFKNKIKNMRRFNQEHCFNKIVKKKMRVERSMTLNIMFLVSGFLIRQELD